ncbi:MAG: NUDIX hydrolase [Chloroflexi bacterium]|nr:NUDIX hydrolase [Chloroflexota bacterium]
MRDVSAGGVVLRREEGRLEVALVGKLSPKRWGLPKGGPRQRESLEQAALREVEEETGLQVRLIRPIGEIDYWFRLGGVRHFKTVHFYLMEAVGGDMSRHDHEYDVVEWFPLDAARREMSYPSEVEMLDRAQDSLIKSGPSL